MRKKIRDWLISIDDKKIERIAYYISNLILIGFGIVLGYLIKLTTL
jgi:hypothetical protein